jgi:hypothetical protein
MQRAHLQRLDRDAEHRELSEHSASWRQQLRAQVVSVRRQKRIEREFDSKAEYLVERSEIDHQTARVLKKLHQYRNETYHRDQLRSEVLDSAVTIYAVLTCDLMRRLTPTVFSALPVPPILAKYEPHLGSRIDFDSQSEIADHLERANGLDEPLAIGQALSDHVVARLDEMLEMLEFCGSSDASVGG